MYARVAAAAAALLLGTTGACSSSTSSSAPPVAPTSTTSTTAPANPNEIRWELATDFGRHPADNPFSRAAGGPKVWSLRQSVSLDRTGTYPRLRKYSRVLRPGVAAWHGTNEACGGLPAIGVTAGRPALVCGATIPEHAVLVSPSPGELAVVGWQSPIAGEVVIATGLADLDSRCGGRVSYWVDRGTMSLAHGNVARGGSKTLPTVRTPVARGESISFIVGPSAPTKPGCDATQLQVTIAPGQ